MVFTKLPTHNKSNDNQDNNKYNNLEGLNNFLFGMLERLDDPDCDIEKETMRAKAMVDVSKQIIDNARLTLDALQYASDCETLVACGGKRRPIPAMLDINDKK